MGFLLVLYIVLRMMMEVRESSCSLLSISRRLDRDKREASPLLFFSFSIFIILSN